MAGHLVGSRCRLRRDGVLAFRSRRAGTGTTQPQPNFGQSRDDPGIDPQQHRFLQPLKSQRGADQRYSARWRI